MIETVAAAIAAFISTNIDDLFVLTALFGMRGLSPWQVVAGQYLGFAALTGLSLAGSLGTLVVPRPLIGLLGLFPVYMGVHELVASRKGDRTQKEQGENASAGPQPWQPNGGHRARPGLKVLQIALITVGNGGDNIATYVPLFAQVSWAARIWTAGVFLTLVGAWCYAGYRLRYHPRVAGVLERHGHRIVPAVLIGLGLYILLRSGAIGFFLMLAR